MKNTFKKVERLKKKKDIQELFNRGSSFYLYPFKILFIQENTLVDEGACHQILISVPKRKFKKAVDRNKLKRRIREAYRLNKRFLDFPGKLLIAYIYTAKDILPYQEIESKLVLSLKRLVRETQKNK